MESLGDWSLSSLKAARIKNSARSLSLSYENTTPLLPIRACGSKIFSLDNGKDEVGYLDTRNNVPHVGHNHPVVVKAAAAQLAQMNTNSRYLHPAHVNLTNRLLSTFPASMNASEDFVVFLVNSGSEANDLAVRLAQANWQHKNPVGFSRGESGEIICVDRAYHGNTQATVGLSPYKWGPNDRFKPHNVTKVACPSPYHDSSGVRSTGQDFAKEVEAVCTAKSVAGFIVESGMSVAGVILPPEGYLKHCYDHVRKVGGVTIADEVQTGFGRFGEHFWGFEQQGVEPDIITMGKPFGNGLPLAACVCRRSISDKFDEAGIEYFNTFGGNLVSCAAGAAVLDVIEGEGLMRNARDVGKHLKDGFEKMSSAGTLVGDVRGMGLFIGVELVIGGDAMKPATKQTSRLCSILKVSSFLSANHCGDTLLFSQRRRRACCRTSTTF